jgi:hypothetical protein
MWHCRHLPSGKEHNDNNETWRGVGLTEPDQQCQCLHLQAAFMGITQQSEATPENGHNYASRRKVAGSKPKEDIQCKI